MRPQTVTMMEIIETIRATASFSLNDVVQIECITFDVDLLFVNWGVMTDGFDRPGSTLLGIDRLAFPELLVEIATSVQ